MQAYQNILTFSKKCIINTLFSTFSGKTYRKSYNLHTMLYGQLPHLEDKIIQIINTKRTIPVKELIIFLRIEGERYSSQGVYKTLNNLIQAEVVIKQGKNYSINEEWRNRVIKKLQPKSLTNINEGEKVHYELTSLIHHDLQWKNIVLPLHEEHPSDPIFFYNHHYIWLFLSDSRKQSELDYYKSFSETKTYSFCLIGSSSFQDRATKDLIKNDYSQVATGREPALVKTGYITIFNDYIITTQLPKDLVGKIESCYQSTNSVFELERSIRKLGIEKRRVQLIIERNKEKAKLIRKKISPDFHIPKELRDKFELF